MAGLEDTPPASAEVVSLCEAFQRLGQAMFGPRWVETCTCLSPGRFRAELADEAPIIPDPNFPEETLALQQQGHQIASARMVECYEKTRDALLEALWLGQVPSLGITADGRDESVPKQAWKDRTGRFVVSISDSEVTEKENASARMWRVKIDATALSDLIGQVKATRQTEEPQPSSAMTPKEESTASSGDPPDPQLMKDAEVAHLLAMSQSWVKGQRFKRRHGLTHVFDIDPVMVASKPRYRRAEVLNWLKRRG